MGQSPSDTAVANTRLIGAKVFMGVSVPDRVTPASTTPPAGVEMSYSWVGTSRNSWETCNCFAKTGVYANYYTFHNPVALGRTAGAGLFFEPLIRYRHRTYFSVRTSAGLTYLTRVYNAETNPTNEYFSLPLSAMIGVAANAHYKLTSQWHANLAFHYNHISNAGTKKPNVGLNVPVVGLGVSYAPQPTSVPATRDWEHPALTRRWFARVDLMGSVRVLSPTDPYVNPKTFKQLHDGKDYVVCPMWGADIMGGYRVTTQHAFSIGAQYIDDTYIKNQGKSIKDFTYKQLGLMAGYEFWYGQFAFTAHWVWNLIQPSYGVYIRHYTSFQRYSLRYQLRNGLTVGVGVKADQDVTKGFHALIGYTLY